MKRLLIALVVAAIVFASVFAAAATLSVSTDPLGANNVIVGVCDSDGVTTSYTNAWDATDARYEVTSLTVKGVSDSCDGKTLKVTLTNGANADVGSGSITIPTSAAVDHAVPLSTNPAAKDVANVHVVIS
jgi:hypothetical protein